ncbi:diguanylate cyclase domain-containing protein [Neptuniibacter sp. QD48_55]|uniref:diguanylate cyclase domain-containing protein n=1 Tax=Neptuniibacter sp. QD48_55 TaxID=3398212 RepID=UPI0039F46709
MEQRESGFRFFFYLIGFSAIFLAFIYTSVFSYQQYASLRAELTTASSNNDIQLRTAMAMRAAVRERAILLWQMTLLETPEERKQLFNTFYSQGSEYHKSRLTLLNTDLDHPEQIIITKLDKEAANRAPELRTFSELLNNNRVQDFRSELGKVLKDKTTIAGLLDRFISLQQAQNEEIWQDSSHKMEVLLSKLIVRMVLIILGGFLFAVYVMATTSKQNKLIRIANQELRHLACHDNLTGLPNRRFLLHQLDIVLAAAKRKQHKVAIIFIDLDDFKPINDTYGHDIGDQCLQDISNRISKVIRGSDMLGRLGGDEFLLILSEIESSTQAIAVIQKILTIINEDIPIESSTANLSASIGLYIYALEDINAEEAITLADKAMYQAKKMGKNQFYII